MVKMIRLNNKIPFSLVCLLFVLSLTIGCATKSRMMALSAPPAMPPRAHAWKYLFKAGGEPRGYATYSYVLVGRDENDKSVTSKYIKLIDSIKGSTSRADSLSVDKSRLNCILIPAKIDRSSFRTKHDYQLSRNILTTLSVSCSQKFNQPGPYIITLYKPISSGEEEEIADLLYVDMTNMGIEAISEVVRTYKEAVLDEKIAGINKLKSLRLSILRIALIVEDSIGFARVAYGELRNASLVE